MWLYLEKDFRPPEAYAQWASSTILRETYLTFALWTSAIAIAMWVIALLFSPCSAVSRDRLSTVDPSAIPAALLPFRTR